MMDRRQTAKLIASLTVFSPSLLRAQTRLRVLVIGAGAAGLTAAYHLKNSGADVRVLEASDRWGGRLKRLTGLSDVPLDLGAEWIHDEATVLGQIIGQGDTTLGVETIAYRPQTYQSWHRGRLRNMNALRLAYEEVKFLDTTWYGFFERFVWPQVRETVSLNAPVVSVQPTSEGVSVRMRDGRVLDADRILVTVPLSVLQDGEIEISDGDFDGRLADLRDIPFGSGFKVFIKFAERFYPDILLDGPGLSAFAQGWEEKIFYDAALGKPTEDNILGLFTVSQAPLARAALEDRALLEDVLGELTGIYGDVVNRGFIAGDVQNWTQEPYIRGSYCPSSGFLEPRAA